MRITVFVIAGLQAAAILAALMSVLFGDNDPAGRALGSAYTTLAAIAFAAVVGPALMLAYWNKWLGLALGLALAGPVAITVIVAYAVS
jgi:hypothetical protein